MRVNYTAKLRRCDIDVDNLQIRWVFDEGGEVGPDHLLLRQTIPRTKITKVQRSSRGAENRHLRSKQLSVSHSKYNITADNFFWPLPFGRTNVLPSYVLQFCDFIARHFHTQLNAARKLRASFSRAISVGVARTINIAIRRLQLSTAARVGVPSVSTLCLRDPFAPSSPRRSIPKPPQLSLQTEQRICARLAVILKSSSEDLSSSLQSGSGLFCVDADTTVAE